MERYKLGDAVIVNGKRGEIFSRAGRKYVVEVDGKRAFYTEAEISPVQPVSAYDPNDMPGNWDYYTPAKYETEALVTVKSIERYEKAVKSSIRCRRCGSSSLNGAMFTTGGGDVCDDCF